MALITSVWGGEERGQRVSAGRQPAHLHLSVGFIHRFIHHDDGGGSQRRLCADQVVEIHQDVVAHVPGDDGSGGAARDDPEKVVPPPFDSACTSQRGSDQGWGPVGTSVTTEVARGRTCVSLYQLPQRDGHLLLHRAGEIDVAGDVEEFRPGVPLPAEA